MARLVILTTLVLAVCCIIQEADSAGLSDAAEALQTGIDTANNLAENIPKMEDVKRTAEGALPPKPPSPPKAPKLDPKKPITDLSSAASGLTGLSVATGALQGGIDKANNLAENIPKMEDVKRTAEGALPSKPPSPPKAPKLDPKKPVTDLSSAASGLTGTGR